jgi:glycine/D-amino acid oxidase-like deaminating enzyme
MTKNRSPWLHQLKAERHSNVLISDEETDVAIVGAGIAGISTAFFVLKYTDLKVLILEKFKFAHGATGNNAGQVVSYFERGFASLAKEFGLEKAADAQKSVEDAWLLMDEMYTDAEMDFPFERFLGHAGLSSKEQVLQHLENNYYRTEAGLKQERIWISKDATFLNEIKSESKYDKLYSVKDHEEIKQVLETSSDMFLSVVSYQKGVVNSALFCEAALVYLEKKYADRFMLYEHADISKIVLKENKVLLDAYSHTIEAKKVVLCTNGFEDITIVHDAGLDIDTKFHFLVKSAIGYMSGYLENFDRPAMGISYFTTPDADSQDPYTSNPYFYITRRPYEYEEGKKHNLISIGGPEVVLQEGGKYSYENDCPEDKQLEIDNFVKNFYEKSKKIDYIFTWHGLMGYTKNGVRLVGVEPKNPNLLYNIGCNGIGILPSIFGGRRITRILAGEKLESSIFDIPADTASEKSEKS